MHVSQRPWRPVWRGHPDHQTLLLIPAAGSSVPQSLECLVGNFLQARSCLSTYHVPGAHLALRTAQQFCWSRGHEGVLEGLGSLLLAAQHPGPSSQGPGLQAIGGHPVIGGAWPARGTFCLEQCRTLQGTGSCWAGVRPQGRCPQSSLQAEATCPEAEATCPEAGARPATVRGLDRASGPWGGHLGGCVWHGKGAHSSLPTPGRG